MSHQHSWVCAGCGATMTEQPRLGDGTFTHKHLGEARDVDLVAAAPPKGSFLYPPFLETAEEAIAFWESVDIPDEVCAMVASEYVAKFAATVEHWPTAVWQTAAAAEWEQDDPRPADPAQVNAWEARKMKARDEFVAAHRATLAARPETLDPRDVRQAAKVCGLLGAAKELPPAEKEKVSAYPIRSTAGTMPLRQFVRSTGVGRFAPAIRNPDTYKQPTDERLRQLVNEVVSSQTGALRTDIRREFHANSEELSRATETLIDLIGRVR